MILGKFANKSFVTRLCSGIVLVALILATVVTGGYVLFGFNFLISMLAVYELYKVLGIEKTVPGITGYVALIGYYALIFTDKTQYTLMLIIVFLICLLAEYVFMFPKFKTEQISNALMCMLYGGVLLSYVYLIRNGIMEHTQYGLYSFAHGQVIHVLM